MRLERRPVARLCFDVRAMTRGLVYPGGAMADDEPTNILVVDDLPEKLLVYRAILDELGQNLDHRRVRRGGAAGCPPARLRRHPARRQHAGDERAGDGGDDPPAEAVGPHADHLPDRLRRRGADGRGLRPGRGGLHHDPGRPGHPAGQGARVRRPVPDDAAGPAAGRGADRAGRGADEAGGGRGGQPPARLPRPGPGRFSASRSTRT